MRKITNRTSLTRYYKARKTITAHTKDSRNVIGTLMCPICKEGRLKFSVNGSGRIDASCSQRECVRWSE